MIFWPLRYLGKDDLVISQPKLSVVVSGRKSGQDD